MSLYSRRSACLGARRLRELQIAAASGSPIFFCKAKRKENDIQLCQDSWVVDLLKIFGLISSSDAWSRGFCWWFGKEVLGDCHDVGILNCDSTHTHTKTKKHIAWIGSYTQQFFYYHPYGCVHGLGNLKGISKFYCCSLFACPPAIQPTLLCMRLFVSHPNKSRAT